MNSPYKRYIFPLGKVVCEGLTANRVTNYPSTMILKNQIQSPV